MSKKFKFFFLKNLNSEYLLDLEYFIRDFDKSSYLYTLPYNKFIDRTFSYKNFSYILIFNKKIVAYLPQWKKNNILVSVPWRDGGGPLFEDKQAFNKILAMQEKLLLKFKNLKKYVWHQYYTSDKLYNFYRLIEQKCILKEFKLISKDAIKNIKKITKNNRVNVIQENNITETLLNKYFYIFQSVRKNLGVISYTKNYFENHLNILKKQSYFFSYKFNNEIIGFAIIYFLKDKATLAFCYSLKKYNKYFSNDFLYFFIIDFLKKNQFTELSLGGDSCNQTKLIKFKKKYSNFERKLYDCSDNIDHKIFDHNKSAYSIIKLIIKYCPFEIYKILSKVYFKYAK